MKTCNRKTTLIILALTLITVLPSCSASSIGANGEQDRQSGVVSRTRNM
jgi:hypothetical protein